MVRITQIFLGICYKCYNQEELVKFSGITGKDASDRLRRILIQVFCKLEWLDYRLVFCGIIGVYFHPILGAKFEIGCKIIQQALSIHKPS